MPRLTTLAAALLTVVLTATGCSSGSGSSEHGHADVAFASQMIPHHAQAVAMADMTIGQPGISHHLARLAERVREAQTPEIDTMAGWLKEWGEPVPQTGYGTGDAHDHSEGMDMMDGGSDGMPGMMSGRDMRRLSRLHGAEFERRWLTMMIEHHQGAVQMSQTELERGRSKDALALAEHVITAQRAEIEEMRALLRTRP
jgi:uncharacterized protein (DUF305 family)